MSDKMRLLPFSELFERALGELKAQGSVFNIKKEKFYKTGNKSIKVFSQEAKSPLGPAAGPHTQLAQNIITSYLVGSRFIELKTVQILDSLEIAKPCIDARDEGYNTEWSTELSLEQAYDEYLKAYFFLHAIDIALDKDWEKPSFIFNMSVGYNLEGIKSEKMQKYIDSMIDARRSPLFEEYKGELKAMLSDGLFDGTAFEGEEERVIKHLDDISPNISPSLTLSTMHGCPPHEIEAIANYMLTEKGLDTFVKLNPTLLGYDEVRGILDSLGYDYLTLKRESFEHDLQYEDAVPMLTRLRSTAKKNNRGFGVKLTNTLGSVNDQGMLPGDEMYGSGRALMPLSLSVALKLSKEFDGTLPISYSGGAQKENIREIFETGIRPITMATELLQPGGYYRLSDSLDSLEVLSSWESDKIDIEKLEELVKKVRDPKGIASKHYKGEGSIKLNRPLPILDCFVAPCVEACPIHQMIPEYVNMAGEGKKADALALIYLDNALPNITGWICSHECQNHCTRKDYEGPVKIREVKRRLAESVFDEYKAKYEEESEKGTIKAAVVGAGPAGLSAAYFLANAGFDVTVFEKDMAAGGVVQSTIPDFRIPSYAVEKDVEFIKSKGVEFKFGQSVSIKELKDSGYEYIFLAIGAEKSRDGRVKGNGRRLSAISMLRSYKEGKTLDLGKNVVIVGAGNTAMDASRAAKRVPSVESVSIVYRRSSKEMPADYEEYEEAVSEGIQFNWLVNPVELKDGILTLEKMALGEKDESGRRAPVGTGEMIELPCSTLISAIGESVSDEDLRALGYSEEESKVFLFGDAESGPSTVVECIASARSAVEKAIDMVYENMLEEEDDEESCECGGHHHHHHHHDGCTCGCEDEEEEEDEDEELEEDDDMREEEDQYYSALLEKKTHKISSDFSLSDDDFFKREASRCLECSYLCSKCVDVCPNRANVAIDMREWSATEDPFEIVHIDAYCNECGNCETFCPYSGGPYKKKFTIFSSLSDFDDSSNSGFFFDGEKLTIRLSDEIVSGTIEKDGTIDADIPAEIAMLIDEIFENYHYLLGPVEE